LKAIKKNRNLKAKYLIPIWTIVLMLVLLFWLRSKTSTGDSYIQLIEDQNIPKPICNTKSGFYQDSVHITLINPDSNRYEILFTTDGTQPTLLAEKYKSTLILTDNSNSPNVLSNIKTSPYWTIPKKKVRKSNIIRAVCIDKNKKCGKELILNLIINKDTSIKNTDIVSLLFDNKNFFGYHQGIYVMGAKAFDKDNLVRKRKSAYMITHNHLANYFEIGEDFERDAIMEYMPFNKNKKRFQAPVKVRIHGFNSREFPKKSLRIKIPSEDEIPKYDFFESSNQFHYPTLLFRNGGSDYLGVHFRDGLIHSILENTHLETSKTKPVIMFFNGEYWGIHNFRYKIDRDYLSRKYKIPQEGVTILENEYVLVDGNPYLKDEFKSILQSIFELNPQDKSAYNLIEERIDVSSLIDMYIANFFFCNMDWLSNNIKYWKYQSNDSTNKIKTFDNKWRWILYDMDMTMGLFNTSNVNSDIISKLDPKSDFGRVFNCLINVESFKSKFINRFQILLNTNLTTENIIRNINQFESLFSPIMEEDLIRWSKVSKESWEYEVKKLKEFAQLRPQIQADQLNEFFQLKGKNRITIKKANSGS
jgi:hypothetical protein